MRTCVTGSSLLSPHAPVAPIENSPAGIFTNCMPRPLVNSSSPGIGSGRGADPSPTVRMSLLVNVLRSSPTVISATARYSPGSSGSYGQSCPERAVPGTSVHASPASARRCHFELWTV